MVHAAGLRSRCSRAVNGDLRCPHARRARVACCQLIVSSRAVHGVHACNAVLVPSRKCGYPVGPVMSASCASVDAVPCPVAVHACTYRRSLRRSVRSVRRSRAAHPTTCTILTSC